MMTWTRTLFARLQGIPDATRKAGAGTEDTVMPAVPKRKNAP